MGLIDELLLDGLLGGLGPSTSRGLLVLATLFAVAVTGVSGWWLATGLDPLHGPEWIFSVLLVSILGAPIALFFSVVVLLREPDERALAAGTVVANAAAFLTTIAAVIS